MTLEAIINLIATNGMSIVIIAYFLFKDYKFNQQICEVLNEVREVQSETKGVLTVLKEVLTK